MLKLRSGEHLMFGLSARNLQLLQQGKPIHFDLRDLGLPSGRVTIFYGATEEQMQRDLEKSGLIFSKTKGSV